MINKKMLSVVIIAVLIVGGVAIGLSIAFWPREGEEGNLFLLPPGEEQVPENAFISVWNTSKPGPSLDDQVRLPLEEVGEYNFTVDWGDGNNSEITNWDDANKTHTYPSDGVYTINITGKIIGWRFNYGGDKDKLLEIKQWGSLRLGNSGGYFYGCSNLNITATDILDLTGTTDLSFAFRQCSTLDTVPSMNSWDVSNVEDMNFMFFYANKFNQDIGNWDVSSVTTMSSMFSGANKFNQYIGNWDVSSVTTMRSMFGSAYDFNQDISSWNVSKVEDMSYMFFGADAFNQDLSTWNISSVTDMTGMFNYSALTTDNYDSLLIGWSNLTGLQSSVTLGVGNVKYSSVAQRAHDFLVDDKSWKINDGGLA